MVCNGWIKCGYNMEKCIVDELNFTWGKSCFAIFLWYVIFTIAITRIYFGICELELSKKLKGMPVMFGWVWSNLGVPF